MDILYSWSLLVALAAGAVGVLLGIFAVLRSAANDRRLEANIWARLASVRAAFGAVVLGALGLVISVTVHWRWGHGPASLEPMDVTNFVPEHKAFLAAGLVIVVGLVVAAYAHSRGT